MDSRKPWLCHASLRYYRERQTSKATSVPPAPDTQAPERSASDISEAALKGSVVIVQLLLMGVIGKRAAVIRLPPPTAWAAYQQAESRAPA